MSTPSVTRAAYVLAALLGFSLLATANAGGYRYGVSDQAFYVPAISLGADPTRFPADRGVFEPQMRLWLGDEILGTLVRATGVPLPVLFAGLYLLTMAALVAGATAFARALGCRWEAVALMLVIMTLRHRIPKTGANSLEGYMHPRMLAFALGLAALAALVRLRWGPALLWTLAAAVVHTSTAIWFGLAIGAAFVWQWPARRGLLGAAGALALLGPGAAASLLPGLLPTMDAEWLGVLADRDYLFSLDWPAYAWALNVGSVALLAWLLAHRQRAGTASPGEAGLLAGVLALVVIFVGTLPATAAHVALAITLQANRVFWLIDVSLAAVGAWWLAEELPRLTGRRGLVALVFAAVTAFSVARGVYVLRVETTRPLVEIDLPATPWTETMRWLREQPADWNVLADPGHAWKFGSSVRVAALRDTPLELGKDPAMAMYDQRLARRVAERSRTLAHFDTLTLPDVRRLGTLYDVDVFVDQTTRRFELPVLFRNAEFVVYDLR
jgi:hypothetical protein